MSVRAVPASLCIPVMTAQVGQQRSDVSLTRFCLRSAPAAPCFKALKPPGSHSNGGSQSIESSMPADSLGGAHRPQTAVVDMGRRGTVRSERLGSLLPGQSPASPYRHAAQSTIGSGTHTHLCSLSQRVRLQPPAGRPWHQPQGCSHPAACPAPHWPSTARPPGYNRPRQQLGSGWLDQCRPLTGHLRKQQDNINSSNTALSPCQHRRTCDAAGRVQTCRRKQLSLLKKVTDGAAFD
jgi:hypothetical protein